MDTHMLWLAGKEQEGHGDPYEYVSGAPRLSPY